VSTSTTAAVGTAATDDREEDCTLRRHLGAQAEARAADL
jgi:hypothetical protein